MMEAAWSLYLYIHVKQMREEFTTSGLLFAFISCAMKD